MSEIEVLQIPMELEPMRALYRKTKPERVLEIGSWQGGTLRVWLTEGKPKRVVAVDVKHQNPELYEDWRSDPTELEVIEGDSQDDAIKSTIRRLGPFDWIFIDGDHGEWYAVEDARLAEEVAAPGALILLHDVTDCPGNGPRVAFERCGEGRSTWEFVDPDPKPWGHGIGVVQL